MPHEVKIAIIKRARLARGLVNVLKDDVECINIDAEYFDLYNITESIKEAIRTVDKLKEDNLYEKYLKEHAKEILVYMIENDEEEDIKFLVDNYL